jgi:hypothetical protein
MLVTDTEKVQLELGPSVTPDSLTDPGRTTSVGGAQVVAELLGLLVVKPTGYVSLKAMPVRLANELGLETVMVMLVDPPTGMEEAENILVIIGGAITLIVAVLDALPVPDSVDLTALVVLFCTPVAIP